MNRKQRYGTLAATAFAVTLVATLALVPLVEQQAFARPNPCPTAEPCVGPHVMKINLKGVPNGTDRNCNSGSSNNIYTMYGTGEIGERATKVGHQHILWTNDVGGNNVVDHCTENVGTDGDAAQVDLDQGTYFFTIRILGPANDVSKNFLKYCSQIVEDPSPSTAHDDDLCVVDVTVVRDNGRPRFTIPAGLFDDENENQIWSFITGEKFRNAQIDIWEAP